MRVYYVAAAGVSLVLAAVSAWQVMESSDDVDDVVSYKPSATPGRATIEVTVRVGMGPGDIGRLLEESGVITSAAQFNILTALLGYEGVLQAGDYEFQAGTPALTALYRIHRGQTTTRSVTVIEGWRLEEIADAVAAQGIPREEFLAEARVRNFADDERFPFLEDAGLRDSLEGYLYPATYSLRESDTPRSVIEKMLTAFGNNMTSDVRSAAQSTGLDFHEALTLASIIEREARVPEERPVMAQVFLRRLRLGMPLEADPTVQYAVAGDPGSARTYGYWKRELTRADLETDSLYNTYLNKGLPPGPICSPRLESVEAVAHPSNTNYLYFVAKPDGSHAFAETLDEHLENIKKYRPQ